MKVIIFFSLMGVSLISSTLFGVYCLKKTARLSVSLIVSCILNISILGLSSRWWFVTETDGFSQSFGLLYNAIVSE
jgi:hypothetical protein